MLRTDSSKHELLKGRYTDLKELSGKFRSDVLKYRQKAGKSR